MEINQESSLMTAFVCANCARPGNLPSSTNRIKPDVPDFGWPGRVRQVLLPCAGRLHPENVLKAFESGSSIVSVVACQEDNCHYIEGSRRCERRVDYVRSILKEIGLGDERLLLFHLPGSASEDLALAVGKPAGFCSPDLSTHLTEIKNQAIHALRVQLPNPLAQQKPDLEERKQAETGEDQDE